MKLRQWRLISENSQWDSLLIHFYKVFSSVKANVIFRRQNATFKGFITNDVWSIGFCSLNLNTEVLSSKSKILKYKCRNSTVLVDWQNCSATYCNTITAVCKVNAIWEPLFPFLYRCNIFNKTQRRSFFKFLSYTIEPINIALLMSVDASFCQNSKKFA